MLLERSWLVGIFAYKRKIEELNIFSLETCNSGIYKGRGKVFKYDYRLENSSHGVKSLMYGAIQTRTIFMRILIISIIRRE